MKLTQNQVNKLWGETGPYSQANLTIQTRILDDRISRVFLVVDVEINPLTYELVKKHRIRFTDDEKIQQLLDYAEYRGQHFGYVASAFEVEYKREDTMREAQERLKYATESLIKMHKFVINFIQNRFE